VLLVDEANRRVFDQIDGHRTIAEIDAEAHVFFEQLFWQDLVVLDASSPVEEGS
jgi:hypothetical protein